MDITSATTWTVTKNGQEVELDLNDIGHLLDRLAWSGDLIVVDGTSGWSAMGDKIDVSRNENGIQLTLFK
jgi:hypothetical protein